MASTKSDIPRPAEDEAIIVSRSELPHVSKGVHRVMSYFAAEGISKERVNTEQRFKFRGIDDIMNALSRQLVESGILIVPRLRKREIVTHTNSKGTLATNAFVEVDYTFRSVVDGSTFSACFPGEGRDFADKATNKAMSAAYKYMAIQTFCIPVEGDEGDTESPLITKGRQEEESPLEDAPRTRQAPVDNKPKSSRQAKEEGLWTALSDGMALQRTEEELKAWAVKHAKDLNTLPVKWKTWCREMYADHLDRVRKSDRELAERQADRDFDPKTGEVIDDDDRGFE